MPDYPFYEERYTSATVIVVQSGYNWVDICCIGGGGAGRTGGAGGGAVATKEYRVLESEWGTNLTCSVGLSISSRDGGHTTVDGTLNGSAITQLKGGGGARATGPAGGLGGTASGGDTNVSGNAGTDADLETETYGEGGNGLENLFDTHTVLAAGTGGNGDASGSAAGMNGQILVRWKV